LTVRDFAACEPFIYPAGVKLSSPGSQDAQETTRPGPYPERIRQGPALARRTVQPLRVSSGGKGPTMYFIRQSSSHTKGEYFAANHRLGLGAPAGLAYSGHLGGRAAGGRLSRSAHDAKAARSGPPP
jgi:hypothetical protein